MMRKMPVKEKLRQSGFCPLCASVALILGPLPTDEGGDEESYLHELWDL